MCVCVSVDRAYVGVIESFLLCSKRPLNFSEGSRKILQLWNNVHST